MIIGFSRFGAAPAWLNAMMTNNTTPAGYVTSADSEAFSTAAWIAFDGNAAQRAYPNIWHAGTADMTSAPHWVQIQFPAPVTVTSYTLWSRNQWNYEPCDFTLKGSSDGSSWSTVDTVTGANWGNDVDPAPSLNRTVGSPISRAYWRLEVTKVQIDSVGTTSTNNYCELSQLQLFGF